MNKELLVAQAARLAFGVEVLLSIILAARAICVSMSGTVGRIFDMESAPPPGAIGLKAGWRAGGVIRATF